jgi:Flp pilus assembly protein TadD
MSLILNTHLRPSGKPETIAPEIGVYFTDKPQTQYPYLIQLEHDGAIDIPPGNADFLIADDIRLPIDVHVLAIYPHAHYLGKLMEGYATLPDGARKWLIRIPDWDLSWQGVFRLKQPVFLPRGTVVSMRYHYDNSTANVRNPNSPPKEVKGGERSTDEMGHLWLQVLPAAGGDQRAVLEESMARQRLQKYPDDFIANYNVGDILLSRGDAAGAIPYFQNAAKTNPASVIAAIALGEALFQSARLPESVQQFQKALQIDPTFTDARYDLASAEAASSLWEPAAKDFRQVLAARPEDEKAHRHLGEVLFLWGDDLVKAGKNQDAMTHYQESLAFRAGDAELHAKLGVALASLGRFAEAQSEFQAAMRIDPTSTAARQGLATIQALFKKN